MKKFCVLAIAASVLATPAWAGKLEWYRTNQPTVETMMNFPHQRFEIETGQLVQVDMDTANVPRTNEEATQAIKSGTGRVWVLGYDTSEITSYGGSIPLAIPGWAIDWAHPLQCTPKRETVANRYGEESIHVAVNCDDQ